MRLCYSDFSLELVISAADSRHPTQKQIQLLTKNDSVYDSVSDYDYKGLW